MVSSKKWKSVIFAPDSSKSYGAQTQFNLLQRIDQDAWLIDILAWNISMPTLKVKNLQICFFFLSLYPFPTYSLSLPFFLSWSPSLSFPLSPSLTLFLSLSHYLLISFSIDLYFSLSFPLSLSFAFVPYLSLSFFLTIAFFSLFFIIFIFFPLSFPISLTLFLCLSYVVPISFISLLHSFSFSLFHSLYYFVIWYNLAAEYVNLYLCILNYDKLTWNSFDLAKEMKDLTWMHRLGKAILKGINVYAHSSSFALHCVDFK